jgi:hypothetical protein
LIGVSVNCAAETSIEELTLAIPNRQIGVTTVGAIRRLGGMVVPAPSTNNRFHCLLGGITPDEAARRFMPVVANPNR